MAKKVFTDESLATFVDEIKSYTDEAVSDKADASHTHDDYMTVMHPAGAGYFSLNRKSGTTAGDCSFAEGYNGTASGHVSHAEGDTTTASGNFSHSEGAKTTASGAWSHAEGYYSTASGSYSHAEGYSTIAACNGQHAQGMYNIEDTEGEYAHIVGNGTANARANIHTLDWDGNAWFEGDVYVGGTSQSDGHKVYSSENITISTSEPSGGSDGDIWFVPGSRTIWEGNWTSGSITVPGISQYSLFAISTITASSGAAQGTNVIASLEAGAHLRGMGGYPTDASGSQWTGVTHYYVNIGVSGDTLTLNYAKTSAGTKLGIDRIDVLV